MSLASGTRRSRLWWSCLGISLFLAQPAHATGYPVTPDFQKLLVARSADQTRSFYAFGPGTIWVKPDGSLDPGATELLKLIETADADGISPASLGAPELAQAVDKARATPTPEALADAEVQLSRALTSYVAALQKESTGSMVYEASTLRPRSLGDYWTLSEAAKTASLADYIRDMRWMHPLYAPLRHALMDNPAVTPSDRQAAIINLARIREIPDQPNGRHILIDAANATLTMYEGDQAVDTMRVIVGKAVTQTPIYAGYVRYAVLNPYWNVPDNLLRSLIAKNMLAQGPAYMKRQGYEVVDGWEPGAQVLDPKSIDWHAVQRGDIEPHVRQLPSTFNSMGKVKYEFPNVYGIYLHDTPEKDLMLKNVRQLSNGCIRLEDARRLGQWLMEGDIAASGSAPEQRVDLPRPVPIYITYLTARAVGGTIAVGPDPYGHDGTALATAN